jgi:PAS domain S-box-containing protein
MAKGALYAMTNLYLLIIPTLLLSIIIQAFAAIKAIRLISITGRRVAWSLIALALALMSVRRIVPLYRLLTGDALYSPDLLNELIGLVLSLVMAIGISRIAPLFIERREAEEKLRDAAEEMQDLYDHAPCGYHSLDIHGMFLRINTTELQWLGYQEDEIVGKMRFSDLLAISSRQVFEDNFTRFKQLGRVKDLEYEMLRKDGTILPVLLSATSVTDKHGNYLRSRSTIYDITDRKKIEETEHLLSSIVESSDDAIIAKDLHEIILSWNKGAERIFGYTAEEAIGQPITILIPPEREAELAEIMTAIQRGERIEHFTTKRVRKDGQRIFVSLTVSPIRDTTGTIHQASVVSRNITEEMQLTEQLKLQQLHQEELVEQRTTELMERSRELQENQQALMNIVDDLNQKTEELEQANAKLQELDQLKSMFIASMSHELRTPLNSIIGFSSILKDEWIGPVNQEQKENLATIQRSGKHLLNLINDVIDVSKIEAGRIEVRLEEFDLYDLLKEVVQYLDHDIHDKGLELVLHLQHHDLRTDRRRLLQCVINLLSNAVKFTEQGTITLLATVAVTQPDKIESVVITVTDTGIGIAEQDIPRLFRPFERLESPLKTLAPGTGLGLYLTRKLVVDVLGGDILCTSRLGAGSTFTLLIPERLYEKSTGC